MRYLALLAFMGLCVFTSISAQRVGEDAIKIPYQVMPTNPLPDEVVTYSVSVIDPYQTLLSNSMTKSSVTGKTNMRNFKRVGRGDMHLNFRVGNFEILRNEYKTKTTEKKSKDGKVSRSTKYWREVDYKMPVSLTATGPDGSVIHEQIAGGGVKKHSTKSYSSSSALSKAWNAERRGVYAKMKRDGISGATSTLASTFRRKYDITVGTESLYLEYPKGKKAQDGEAWKASVDQTIAALKGIKADTPIDAAGLRTKVKPHLDMWEAKMKEYDPSDKKQQKYYHCAQYNLAVVNFILEDYAAAEAHAAELNTSVKWNKSRPAALSKKITNAKAAVEASPHDSRHFAIRDLEALNNEQFVEEEEEVPAATTAESTVKKVNGHIVMNGSEVKGQFFLPLGDALDFSDKKVRFITPTGYDTEVTPDVVEGFGFEEKTFAVVGMPGKEEKMFVQVLAGGDKMQALQYVNSGHEGMEGKLFLMPAGGELKPLVAGDNFSSEFAANFPDCTTLVSAINAGFFELNAADVTKAVNSYNEGKCN